MELGEYYTALNDYDRSVTLGPQAYAYVARGTVHYRLNEYDTAMDDFNKATLLDRSNTQAFVMRGTIYQEKRNYRRAIDEFTQVIEVIADSVGADISDLEFLSSDIKHELYELALLDLGNAFCGRGVCGSRTKDYDGALADLDAAIRLIPSNANFYCARGIAYIEMGQHEKAMEELEVAIELDPNSTKPLFVKANFHLGKGEFKEAIADVHRAIELNPRWSDLHWIGGTARFLLGEYEEAIEDFSRAIDVASEHHSEPSLQSGGVSLTLGPPIVGSAYVSRAVTYSLLGNDSNARDDFNRALELERSQTEIEEDITELISDEKIRETVVDLVRSVKIDGRAGITQQSKDQVSKSPSLRRPAHSEKLVQRPVVRGHRTLAKEEYTDLFRRLGFYDIETGKTLKHQKPIPSIYFNCRYGAVSFVAYRRDKHRYRPKLWDQLPPQKKKDAKHNLMTIVPKVGKEQEAFEEILV